MNIPPVANAPAEGLVSAPAGFAPVFAGWNVWDLWVADDPDTSILNSIWTAGESAERVMRVWVEDELSDNAPGSAVADPANPAALKGDQIQPIPKVDGLAVAVSRANVPEFAGAQQVGKTDSTATLHTVRFFNRGAETVMPWPHDTNFLLDAVYTPSASNPVTNAPQPSSLPGVLGQAASAASAVAEGVAVIGALWLLSKLIGSRRS